MVKRLSKAIGNKVTVCVCAVHQMRLFAAAADNASSEWAARLRVILRQRNRKHYAPYPQLYTCCNATIRPATDPAQIGYVYSLSLTKCSTLRGLFNTRLMRYRNTHTKRAFDCQTIRKLYSSRSTVNFMAVFDLLVA